MKTVAIFSGSILQLTHRRCRANRSCIRWDCSAWSARDISHWPHCSSPGRRGPASTATTRSPKSPGRWRRERSNRRDRRRHKTRPPRRRSLPKPRRRACLSLSGRPFPVQIRSFRPGTASILRQNPRPGTGQRNRRL
jgi:hypothetical protein